MKTNVEGGRYACFLPCCSIGWAMTNEGCCEEEVYTFLFIHYLSLGTHGGERWEENDSKTNRSLNPFQE